MIRSVYDYGSVILTTIPKTRLDKLEQVQNQVLCSSDVSNQPRKSKYILLNIETGIYPVKDRWDQLAYNYLLRVNGKPWNRAYDTIHHLNKEMSSWKTNSTPAEMSHLR